LCCVVVCYIILYYIILFNIISRTARFSETVCEYKICFIYCTNLSKIFLILRRTRRDVIINVDRSLCPSFLPYFIENRIIATNFRNVIRYQISSKSVRWELSCSIRAGGRTDRKYEATQFFRTSLKTLPSRAVAGI
jgi:hypothetical protein